MTGLVFTYDGVGSKELLSWGRGHRFLPEMLKLTDDVEFSGMETWCKRDRLSLGFLVEGSLQSL